MGQQRVWQRVKAEGINSTPLAFAPAPPGGVVYRCAAGSDRTGVLTVLLLALAGVDADSIADDYDLSHAPLRAMFAEGRDLAALDRLDQVMLDRRVSTRDAIRSLLDGFDVRRYLLSAGVQVADLAAVRDRLLDD